MNEKFKYCGKATVLNVKPKKEGSADQIVVAVDVGMVISTVASDLAFFDDKLTTFFFKDDGMVRNKMMSPISFLNKICDYRLEILDGVHHGVTLKKFSLAPVDGFRVLINFCMSFYPCGTEIARLTEFLKESIHIFLMPSDMEFRFNSLGEAA